VAATGWSSGLGVIHYSYGPHRYGSYDAILPGWAATYGEFGWSTTAGWYTGPGYCTVQLRSDDDGLHWARQYPDLGSGQHFIGAHTSYEVEPYRC
jgi:hypothetical protein